MSLYVYILILDDNYWIMYNQVCQIYHIPQMLCKLRVYPRYKITTDGILTHNCPSLEKTIWSQG